jgi:hypothetical protein
MNATTDLDLVDPVYTQNLGNAVEAGLVEQATINASVWRSMLLRFRLGDFDPESMVCVAASWGLSATTACFCSINNCGSPSHG